MNLGDIRTHVRDTMDLDATELPNAYLDVLCTEATYDIASRSRRWPLYEQAPWTFVTVADQHAYVIADKEPANTDVAEIVSVIDETAGGFSLTRVDHHAAESAWRNTLDASSFPRLWSQWGGSIYLWPAPSDVRTMTVRSYRKTNDWVDDGSDDTVTPDLDTRLHVAVALYVLIRCYEQQEDSQLAERYRGLYESYLAKVMQEILRLPEGPIVLNGGLNGPRMTEDAWFRMLAYSG